MEFYPGFETQPKKRKNLTKIQILDFSDSMIPAKILLRKMCLLRFAEKVGDIEVVNNVQLGRLKQYNVTFTKLPL